MFKKKNTKTNEDVVTASGVTISPALAEIIERKKNGLSAPAKKTKAKKIRKIQIVIKERKTTL